MLASNIFALGVTTIEAEEFDTRTSALVGTSDHQWFAIASEASAIGTVTGTTGDYMQALTSQGADSSDLTSQPSSPYLEYEINVAEAGLYTLELAMAAPSHASDSVWAGISTGTLQNAQGLDVQTGVFEGLNVARGADLAVQWQGAGIWELSEGANTIRISMRESGVIVDSLRLERHHLISSNRITEIEAEDYDTRTTRPISGTTYQWFSVPSEATQMPTISGATGGYMHVLDSTGQDTSEGNSVLAGPYLEYDIYVAESGLFALELDLTGVSQASNSVFFDIPTGTLYDAQGLPADLAINTGASSYFQWAKAGIWQLEAGAHTLRVAMRESGTAIDALRLLPHTQLQAFAEIQAEDFNNRVDGTVGGESHRWLTVNEETAGQGNIVGATGQYMQSLTAAGVDSAHTNYGVSAPFIDHYFYVDEEGLYDLDIAVAGLSSSSDDLWAKFTTGTLHSAQGNPSGLKIATQADGIVRWRNSGLWRLTAGTHVLRIAMHESGTVVDAIRISRGSLVQDITTIEAEDFSHRESGTVAGTPHEWFSVATESAGVGTISGASGNYVQVLTSSELDSGDENLDPEAPYLDYDIYIATTGDYQLDLATAGVGLTSNSLYASIATGVLNSDPPGELASKVESSSDGLVGWQNAGIWSLAAGSHTLRISMAESGTVLDQIRFARQHAFAVGIPDQTIPQGTTETSIDLGAAFIGAFVTADEPRTYSVLQNDNPTFVETSISGDRLLLTLLTNQLGTATIVVRAADDAGHAVDSSFVVQTTPASAHNPINFLDVNNSGHISTADPLSVINFLIANGPSAALPDSSGIYRDVNNDGKISAGDAKLVINYLAPTYYSMWHLSSDVNDDGYTTSADRQAIQDELTHRRLSDPVTGSLPDPLTTGILPRLFFDINSDDVVSPADLDAFDLLPLLKDSNTEPLIYNTNDAATVISSQVGFAGGMGTTLDSASVRISANYQSGQDVLAFTDTSSITGVWDSGTATLTLSGSATIAEYQAALRSVTYANTSGSPNTSIRTVEFLTSVPTDSYAGTLVAHRQIIINDSPTLNTSSTYAGDFDGDGSVDSLDWNISANQWEVHRGSLDVPWDPGANWSQVVVGDFNGDGRDDLAGFDGSSGEWSVDLSREGSFLTQEPWGDWSTDVAWGSFVTGDFTGDGLDDIAARDLATGQWRLAVSTGTDFFSADWGSWSTTDTWADIQVGDFDGDGRHDILGRNGTSDTWVVALSQGAEFVSDTWGSMTTSWSDIAIVDVNRDGFDDIAGKVGVTWHVARSTGTAFVDNAEDWNSYFNDDSAVFVGFHTRLDAALTAFESVRNTIDYQPYLGSMKGAQATEDTRRGNAWDQAALLVGMLRDNGVQANFGIGPVTVAAENYDKLLNWLGVTTIEAAAQVLLKSGLSPVLDLGAGTITFEHAWVEALLPGPEGLNWQKLDPSWKYRDYQDGVAGILSELGDLFNGATGSYFTEQSQTLGDTFDLNPLNSADRTDTTHTGAFWKEAVGNFDINAKRLRQTTTGEAIAVYENIDAAQVTVEASVDVGVDTTGGVLLRYQDNNNFYWAAISRTATGSTLSLFRRVDGVDTQFGSPLSVPTALATIRLEVAYEDAAGDRLKVYHDDVLKINVYESSSDKIRNAGKTGLYSETTGANVFLDSFEVTSTGYRDQLPLEYFEDQVEDYLITNYPGTSLADVGYRGPIIPGTYTALPTHSAYTVSPSSIQEVLLEDEQTHRVRLVLRSGTESGTILIDEEFTVPDVSLSRITFSDANTDPDLAKPRMRVEDLDGTFVQFVASSDLDEVAQVTLTIEHFNADNITSTPDSQHHYQRKAGQYLAVGLDADQASDRLLQEIRADLHQEYLDIYATQPVDPGEAVVGRTLALTLATYFRNLNYSKERLSALTHGVSIQGAVGSGIAQSDGQTPSDTTVVQYSEDLMEFVIPDQVGVDLPNLRFGSVTVDGIETDNSLRFRTLGIQSSALEHDVVESLFA